MALSKICGITSKDDLEMVLSCEPNAVGFIVDVPVDTPRKISTGIARELIKRVPIFITPVLVIMPEGSNDAIKGFSGILLADWISVYLAVMNKVDPTSSYLLDLMKSRFARAGEPY